MDSGGSITGVGLVDVSVTGETTGGVAGSLKGTAEVSRCYNRGSGSTAGEVTGTVSAGGIAGQMTGGAVIKDCYNMENVITGTGTSSCAGGIAGDGSGGTIANCYHASRIKGGIRSTGTAASIAGNGSVGTVVQCYSDQTLADSAFVETLDCQDDTKLQIQTDKLNMVRTSSGELAERKGTDRVWFTSLAEEGTHGLPTLDAPVMLTVSLDPAAVTEAGGVLTGAEGIWSGGTTPPSGLLFRGIHQENGTADQPGFTPTSRVDVTKGFHTYGTTNAHEKLALEAGGTDLAALTPSLTKPEKTISQTSPLKLYSGAAYIYSGSRALLIDLADTAGGNITRYEIRAELAGVTRNTLDVTLPVKSGIVLKPGEVPTKAYSEVPLEIINNDSCPVEFRITEVGAKEVSDDIDVKLTPVDQEFVINNEVPITDENQGVKLGIKGTFVAENGDTAVREIFYDPGSTPWLSCRIGYGKTFGFEYFMEYSLLHVGPEQRFGFDLSLIHI